MTNHNANISRATAMFNAVVSEIANDQELKKGEKFVLIQRLFVDINKAKKDFEKVEKEIKEWVIDNVQDGDVAEYEGAEVTIKYSYPKPSLDTDKIVEDYSRLLADYNREFDSLQYEKPSTPRKTIKIQSKFK